MLDKKTPTEVEVTPVEGSWLGVEVPVAAQGTPRHRLMAIGDSLTHGFPSGAICNTGVSCPAITAHEMDWYGPFRHPSYLGQGGLPLNLELLVRELEQEFGDEVDWRETHLAPFRAPVRGPGRGPVGARPRHPRGEAGGDRLSWVSRDTLVSNPPRSLTSNVRMICSIEQAHNRAIGRVLL